VPQSEKNPQTITGLLAAILAELQIANELLVYAGWHAIPAARRQVLMETYQISPRPEEELTFRQRQSRSRVAAGKTAGGRP